jgi:hypothetical protein
MWYAASAIFVTRLRDRPKECPQAEERVYLVEADSDDEALSKARAFAKDEEIDGYDFEYDGVAAREEFVGLRKVISVRRHCKDLSKDDGSIADGCEATFSYFALRSEDELTRLVEGDTVGLTYVADPRSS